MSKRRKVISSTKKHTQSNKRQRKPISLESFPSLGKDEVAQVLLFLDLKSIMSFKLLNRNYYNLLGTDVHLNKHMFMLALKTVPPLSLVSSDESEHVMVQLQNAKKGIAEREWEKSMREYWNPKLQRYREIAEHAHTVKQVASYQGLLEKIATKYIEFDHLDKKRINSFDGLPYESFHYFYELAADGGDPALVHGPWQVGTVMWCILDSNDLSVVTKDKYIIELINARIGLITSF